MNVGPNVSVVVYKGWSFKCAELYKLKNTVYQNFLLVIIRKDESSVYLNLVLELIFYWNKIITI